MTPSGDVTPRAMRGRWESYALTVGLVLAVALISLVPTIWADDRPPLILFVIPILIAAYVAGAAAALGGNDSDRPGDGLSDRGLRGRRVARLPRVLHMRCMHRYASRSRC